MPDPVERREVAVGSTRASYLHAGSGAPILLLHGTFWSRVWEPVLADLAAAGREVFAPDFPGFGASGGRLAHEDATIPSLAAWAERFRDPSVADAVTVEELLSARAQSLDKAIARPLDVAERDAWLAPWRDEDRVRSWTAMAGAADSRYTLELMDRLRDRALPTLLVWGEQDAFQPIAFSERYAAEVPGARLVAIPGARHIPTVDEPRLVAGALAGFLAGPGVP
ncbi:MAG: alpha/beta fold hydrolase [Solirubrobacteraceae bacterium]